MIGTLRYSPKLLGQGSKWWLVIDSDPELAKYFRHLYYLSSHKCHKLQRPAWEAHITVVRDEEPLYKESWLKYNGQEVEFSIIQNPQTNGDYYWLPVSCPKALEIRTELGLNEPFYPLHLSIGHGEE